MSPALAGRFSNTVPPGRSLEKFLTDVDEYNFCDFLSEFKKKSHKDSEEKNIQINFHCKVKELLQWRITGLNVNIMT